MTRQPTDFLFDNAVDQRNLLAVYTAIKSGFAIKDVHTMTSTSQLYSSIKLLEKIYGGHSRSCRKALENNLILNSQRSSVAFQYAKGLELAIEAFGSLKLAEIWLAQPCKDLDSIAPTEALENFFGFLAIKEYLEKIIQEVSVLKL